MPRKTLKNGKPEIDLEKLKEGMPGATKPWGASIAEAAAVCLDERGHSCGVHLTVTGSFEASFVLKWGPVTDQMKRCYNDAEVTTELGAYGVSFLLITSLTKHAVIERSWKGTGFDYWLGSQKRNLFQRKARLEVSGIRSGDETDIRRRVEVKKRQTAPTDGALPAYVVVVEFGKPASRVVQKP